MDLVHLLISVAVFVLGAGFTFLVGRKGWGTKTAKIIKTAGDLVTSLADGTITFDEAQKIATDIKDVFTKS